MATTRATRSTRPPVGTPITPEKEARIRQELEAGSSVRTTAMRANVGQETVRTRRDRWIADGSLVLSENQLRRTPSLRAAGVTAATPQNAPSAPSPPAAPEGEVARDASPLVTPITAAAPEPAAGDVGQEPPAAPPGYDRQLFLPPDETEVAVNEVGELVANMKMQVLWDHVSVYQQFVKLGIIPQTMSYNAWAEGIVDEHVATCMGLGLGLIRVREATAAGRDGAAA